MKSNPARPPGGSDVGLSVSVDRYGDVFVTLIDLVALEDYALASGIDGWGYNEYDDEYGWVIGSISGGVRDARTGQRTWSSEKTNEIWVEVTSSVARKGWGPVVYDSMLFTVDRHLARSSRWVIDIDSARGWTYPDQSSVSAQARKVWRYYQNRRSDVDVRDLPEALAGWSEEVLFPYLLMAYRPNTMFDAKPFYRMQRNLEDLLDRHSADHEELARQATKRGLRLFRDVYTKMRSGAGPYPGDR